MVMPPEMRVGFFAAPTVNSSNGICSSIVAPRSVTWTSPNTSHGPAKSIIVAPSVSTNATWMSPCAGAFKTGAPATAGTMAVVASSGAVATNVNMAASLVTAPGGSGCTGAASGTLAGEPRRKQRTAARLQGTTNRPRWALDPARRGALETGAPGV